MIKIKYNNKIRGQISHDNQAQFDALYEQLCYQYTKFGANRSREVETLCPISPVGSFLAGNALDLIRLEPDIELDQKFLSYHFPYLGKQKHLDIQEPKNPNWSYREYQSDAIVASSKIGRGIIDSPTGSGKSLIMYGLLVNLVQMSKGRILILVPNPGLVTQLCDDFNKYGLENYAPCKSSVMPDAKIVVVSRTTLTKNFDLKQLMEFSHLIVDEVHMLKPGSRYEKVIKKVGTSSIFGLTATMPEDPKESWYIKGMVGPIVFKEHTHKLQDDNYLAKINIISFKFKFKNRPLEIITPSYDVSEHPTKQYSEEYHYLEGRLDTIQTITSITGQLKGNTMILFDHTAHGKAIFKEVEGNKVFVNGKVSMDERENIKKSLEESDDLTLVAQSTCFGTGISINNLQNLIICSHSKKMTKIIQQIGRSLRKTKEGSEHIIFIDFHSNFKYSERHWYERLKLYKKFYNKSYDKQIIIEV